MISQRVWNPPTLVDLQHCTDDDHLTRPLLLVTASVDRISIKKPMLIDVDLKIGGAVAWVGRSSMEIRMEVNQPIDGETLIFLRFCFLQFV